jgi:hypothetical protein
MTKKEKKAIIAKLFTEIEQIEDLDNYSLKRGQLFSEIIDNPYTRNNLEMVTKAADIWCKDLDKNMEAKMSGKIAPNNKEFMKLSKVGLLNLIDFSLLPD